MATEDTGQRQASEDTRARLLASGALDRASLRVLRGDAVAALTDGWIAEQGSRLLVVDVPDGSRYPLFQFMGSGDLRAELAPHVAHLQQAGLGSWQTWAWLTTPAALLSGDVPEAVLATDPSRGVRAVKRLANRLREAGDLAAH
jgi:hypothetical protein